MTRDADIGCRHRQHAVLTTNTMSMRTHGRKKNGERGIPFPCFWNKGRLTGKKKYPQRLTIHAPLRTGGGDAAQVPSGNSKPAGNRLTTENSRRINRPEALLYQIASPRAVARLGQRPHYWSASHATTIAIALGQASCALTDHRRPSHTTINLGQ